MPRASQASASTVPRPWALTWSTSSGAMPASLQGGADGPGQAVAGRGRGRTRRRSRPPRRRCVAPRCWACSSSSTTSTPAAFAEHDAVAVAVERPARPSPGRRCAATAGSNRHCRTRLSGLILLSAPPTRKKSASSRRRMRYASPSASRLGHVALGDGVVRPLGVVQDRDVAGRACSAGTSASTAAGWPARPLLAPLLQVDARRAGSWR